MKHFELKFKILQAICRPYSKLIFNICSDDIKMPEGPNLIIANHVTDMDFLILGVKSTQPMHFVLAENIVKNPIFKKFLLWVNDVIVHVKGSKSLITIRQITKKLKSGENVMIFPEGNTTYSGLTTPLDDSIGKLAKVCGANLVMIRIEGGYLSMPRWGTNTRKGPINLVESDISVADLKKMTVEEVTDAINSHLYVDAYANQEKNPKAYSGKKLCEGIERAMYRCPKCGQISSLKSKNNNVNCECGFLAVYDKFGYMTDSDGNKTTVTEYVKKQRTWLENTTGFLFKDIVNISAITDEHERVLIGRFEISAFDDHVEYVSLDKTGDTNILNISDVRNVAIFQKNTMTIFISKSGNDESESIYEIKGGFSFNALKYRDLFEIYKAR